MCESRQTGWEETLGSTHNNKLLYYRLTLKTAGAHPEGSSCISAYRPAWRHIYRLIRLTLGGHCLQVWCTQNSSCFNQWLYKAPKTNNSLNVLMSSSYHYGRYAAPTLAWGHMLVWGLGPLKHQQLNLQTHETKRINKVQTDRHKTSVNSDHLSA